MEIACVDEELARVLEPDCLPMTPHDCNYDGCEFFEPPIRMKQDYVTAMKRM